ncbi:MAG: glycosyltransferase [Oscillospiraceae bacterium]|nr:glycosyltransferase [Oscillospiraceae bacterium]
MMAGVLSKAPRFTLVICVYAKEDPTHFALCLESINAQSRMPDELIIVKDGPLTDELEMVLADFCFAGELAIISLPESVTQGPARARGVLAAKHEWVAMMDSDDLCRLDRFEKQLEAIEAAPEMGILGGQISEFAESPENAVSRRVVPLTHEDIAKYARRRNPFNQMTVMFRRSLAIEAGNYRFFPWFEDYDLWTRMISIGATCANLADTLVDARVGSGMYARRRGSAYIKSEWRMQKQLRQLGFIGGAGFLRNAAVRIPVRLLPHKLIAALYRMFAR